MARFSIQVPGREGVNIMNFKRKRTPSRCRVGEREGIREESKRFDKVMKPHCKIEDVAPQEQIIEEVISSYQSALVPFTHAAAERCCV